MAASSRNTRYRNRINKAEEVVAEESPGRKRSKVTIDATNVVAEEKPKIVEEKPISDESMEEETNDKCRSVHENENAQQNDNSTLENGKNVGNGEELKDDESQMTVDYTTEKLSVPSHENIHTISDSSDVDDCSSSRKSIDIDSDSQEAKYLADSNLQEENGSSQESDGENENGETVKAKMEPPQKNAFDVLMTARQSSSSRTPAKTRKITEWTSKHKTWSHRDTEDYRRGYPGKKDDMKKETNYLFYRNQIPSRPDGDYIVNIHRKWWGNYDLLESHHGYIQWLFPIREQGLNWSAHELQKHEAKKIQSQKETKHRVLTSYKMMLDFYGMRLGDVETGKIEKASNWRPRFMHLNRSYHNYLRITRILKNLGEMGFEHLKAPFIAFLIDEALVHKTLVNASRSCKDYWVHTLRNDEERGQLLDYICEIEERKRKKCDAPETSKNFEAKKPGFKDKIKSFLERK